MPFARGEPLGTGEAADLAVDRVAGSRKYAGTSVQKTVTLTNLTAGWLSGLTAAIGGSQAADFSLSSVPSWLDAGSSAEIGVLFQPQSQVSRSTATVTFMGSVGQSATLSLSGEPLASALTLTPNTSTSARRPRRGRRLPAQPPRTSPTFR